MGKTVQIAFPTRPRLRVSDRAFRKLSRANPELRFERNAKGELIIMAPAAPDSSYRNAGVTAQLWYWNQQTGLGIVFDSSAGFTLPNTAIRGPDAAWMPLARWQAILPHERMKFTRVCPDFIVEIRSKGNSLVDLQEKMREYLDQGVRLGWLIDPTDGHVEIYRTGRPVELLSRPAMLSGEDVLPGFVLDLRGVLFD